jgi:chromosome segregation ATPase
MKALQGKGYKQFIAGPFAPEFLQYLADQGDRGLAILKGGLEKVKKVYADFNATRSNQMAQQAILGPKNRANEIKAMKDEAALRTRLRAKGMDSDQIDYVIEATKAYQDQINANKEQIKVTTNLAKKKALLADNKAIQKEVNLINTNSSAWYANAKAVENSKKSIEDLNTEYLSLNSQLMSSQRQLEEIQKIEPLQDKVSAEEKRIDSLNRSIELRQRESDVISRNIEMKQRELEPIDEQITKLEDLKTNTSELYDDQLKALDTIQKREEQIAQLKQDQLGIAQALSRGDVAGASQAALSMQQQVAQNSRDQSRTAIEAQRQAELDSVEAQITAQKDKRKEIEDKITQYQNDQRVIADAIYKIEQDRIPIQDTIYNLQTQINSETERMDEAYKNTTGRVIELQIEIAKLQKQMRDIGGQATAAGSSIVSDLSSNASQMTMDNGFVNGQYDAKFDKSLPGYGKNNGGSIRKMAFGNLVPGTGMMDRVPALLTPGEFVMRKSAVQAYGPMLAAMNSNVFPKMNLNGSSISTQNGNNASTVYNYDIAVNLNGTDLNADDVANVVMQKIRMGENTRIRSSNYRG